MARRRAVLAVLLVLSGLATAPVAPADGAALPEPYASADAKRGRILFLQCGACHDLRPSGVTKVGPPLQGLPGRRAGQAAGFAYSEALQSSGLAWTPETLDRFIERPAALVPGTLMVFAGVAKPADRAAIVRYVFEQASAR